MQPPGRAGCPGRRRGWRGNGGGGGRGLWWGQEVCENEPPEAAEHTSSGESALCETSAASAGWIPTNHRCTVLLATMVWSRLMTSWNQLRGTSLGDNGAVVDRQGSPSFRMVTRTCLNFVRVGSISFDGGPNAADASAHHSAVLA